MTKIEYCNTYTLILTGREFRKFVLCRGKDVLYWGLLFVLSNFDAIAHFQVAFRLCFKANPSTKPFIWKLVLFTFKFWFIYM